MKKCFLFTLTTALIGACLVLVANEAMSRESHRQEVVQEHNCKYYGPAINKMAGRDVCPPTVNG